MSLAWVIGSGGLLGSAISVELCQAQVPLFNPGFRFTWNDPDLVCEEFKNAVIAFSSQVGHGHWKIYWAAGVGTMHSSECALQQETKMLDVLAASLLGNRDLNLAAGTFVFSSSAGAIYAGIKEEVISESTSVAPINAYGRSKLLQELIVQKINQAGHGATILCCRITTLYGVKRKNGKQQGLLMEIARRILLNEPVHIYVPLETMRDYIDAGSAAKEIVHTVSLLEKSPGIHLKIIASGVSTSVAQILAIFKRICKRNLRLITQIDNRSAEYQRAVQFRSESSVSSEPSVPLTLLEGISKLLIELRKKIAEDGSRS